MRSFRMIAPAVQELSGRLDEFAGRVRRIENRAVFEIPRILSGILARQPSAPLRHLTPAAHPAQIPLH